MTKDSFQKSAADKSKTDTTSPQEQSAAVIKFQPKTLHLFTPRPPMPKSVFGHIMPVAINLKTLPTLAAVSKDELKKESKKDEE